MSDPKPLLGQSTTDQDWMPRFQCTKVVHAARIVDIVVLHPGVVDDIVNEMELAQWYAEHGGALLTLERTTGELATRKVTCDYVDKHKPQVGGYFVLYADGYASWSPADAFEGGYVPIQK